MRRARLALGGSDSRLRAIDAAIARRRALEGGSPTTWGGVERAGGAFALGLRVRGETPLAAARATSRGGDEAGGG